MDYHPGTITVALVHLGAAACLWAWLRGCFLRSYAHLTPGREAEGVASAHGALTRHDIFTPRGWHLRLWGWALSGLALLTLAIAGHSCRPRSLGLQRPGVELSRYR